MPGPVTVAACAQAFEPPTAPRAPLEEAEGARLVVIADSFFAANNDFAARLGNQLLISNAVAWLDPKGLPPSPIEPRDINDRPLERWTPGIERIVLLVSVAAMPLLVIMFASLVWILRRK